MMQTNFVLQAVELILKKYTCPYCGERTARVDPSSSPDQAIKCWKCSTDIGFTVEEFRADTHKLGKAQIDKILKSPALKALDGD